MALVVGSTFYVRDHVAFKGTFTTIGSDDVGRADPFDLLVARTRNTVLNDASTPISHWASDDEMLAAYHGAPL